MPWLTCTVEQISRKTSKPITGDFTGRSVYECAWAALCEWCGAWYFDSQAELLTVRHGDHVWRVRKEKVKVWRSLVREDTARLIIHEAKLRDPEGLEKP